jgi:pimeloyl-ACP methyl ester carboxylesterase
MTRVEAFRPRSLRTFAACVACAVSAVVGAVGAPPAAAAPVPAPVAQKTLPPGGVPGVPVPVLRWADAGNGYQQATAPVPRDYADPRGPTIPLHLVRLPAADPASKIGSLFVNFGGPGAPAAETVLALGKQLFPPQVLARYDLIGVDPRGTGESSPVRCFATKAEQDEYPYAVARSFPSTPAEEARAIAQVDRYAAACRARNGDLLDHVGTLQVARDVDVLRAALGDSQINFVGWSYGTFLGQVIANTFPNRTGRLVLDAVVDPGWATGPAGSISWMREHADEGSWQTLRRFFTLCAQAGPQRCGFAADANPRTKYAQLAARLRRFALTVPVPGRPVRRFGYADLVTVTISRFGLYAPALWPLLADLLQAAYTADTATLAGIYAVIEASTPPGYDTESDAQTAIACGDADNPTDPRRYGQVARARDATVAPYAGSRWAYGALPCAPWRARATERYTGPWTARTAHPVLLVNTRYDPATPYRNAVRVHALLPNSALLTVNGVGHGGLLSGSCAMDAAAQYLLAGSIPPPHTVCRQDAPPFPPPSGSRATAAATAASPGHAARSVAAVG